MFISSVQQRDANLKDEDGCLLLSVQMTSNAGNSSKFSTSTLTSNFLSNRSKHVEVMPEYFDIPINSPSHIGSFQKRNEFPAVRKWKCRWFFDKTSERTSTKFKKRFFKQESPRLETINYKIEKNRSLINSRFISYPRINFKTMRHHDTSSSLFEKQDTGNRDRDFSCYYASEQNISNNILPSDNLETSFELNNPNISEKEFEKTGKTLTIENSDAKCVSCRKEYICDKYLKFDGQDEKSEDMNNFPGSSSNSDVQSTKTIPLLQQQNNIVDNRDEFSEITDGKSDCYLRYNSSQFYEENINASPISNTTEKSRKSTIHKSDTLFLVNSKDDQRNEFDTSENDADNVCKSCKTKFSSDRKLPKKVEFNFTTFNNPNNLRSDGKQRDIIEYLAETTLVPLSNTKIITTSIPSPSNATKNLKKTNSSKHQPVISRSEDTSSITFLERKSKNSTTAISDKNKVLDDRDREPSWQNISGKMRYGSTTTTTQPSVPGPPNTTTEVKGTKFIVKSANQYKNLLEYDLKDMFPDLSMLLKTKKRAWDYTNPDFLRALFVQSETNLLDPWKLKYMKIKEGNKNLRNNWANRIKIAHLREKVFKERKEEKKLNDFLKLNRGNPEFPSVKFKNTVTSRFRHSFCRNRPPVPPSLINYYHKHGRPPFKAVQLKNKCLKLNY